MQEEENGRLEDLNEDFSKDKDSIASRATIFHGKTLESILTELVDFYGWEKLGAKITVKCFNSDPSISSSLKFLRKTPWARKKVENLYYFMVTKKKQFLKKQAKLNT
jgi:uncharacterized protein (DUF2132 family)